MVSGNTDMHMFFMHTASLCLLVGASNPFTFKVIIHMYDPIVFLIVLDLLSVDLFLFLFFCLEKFF